jgi:hypothetical protein
MPVVADELFGLLLKLKESISVIRPLHVLMLVNECYGDVTPAHIPFGARKDLICRSVRRTVQLLTNMV